MNGIIFLVDTLFSIYIFIVFASVIMSWLLAFNVINQHNQFVRMVAEFLHRATEPLLAPIRKILPNLGPLDISPVILLVLLMFLRTFIVHDVLVGFL